MYRQLPPNLATWALSWGAHVVGGENGLVGHPLTSTHSPWFTSVSGAGHFFQDCQEGAGLLRGPCGEEEMGQAIWGGTLGFASVKKKSEIGHLWYVEHERQLDGKWKPLDKPQLG